MITQELLHKLFDYDPDTGIVTRKVTTNPRAKAGDIVGSSTGKRGYLDVQINKKRYKLHRIIWLYVYGYLPINFLDHINRIRTDNRISNLRECSAKQNQGNRTIQKNSSTGIKGVYKQKNGYTSRIGINGKSVYLGSFKYMDDAREAYQKKAKEIFGEFFTEGERNDPA